MSLHAGQVKKLLRGQIIIAKVTLERAPSLGDIFTSTNSRTYTGVYSFLLTYNDIFAIRSFFHASKILQKSVLHNNFYISVAAYYNLYLFNYNYHYPRTTFLKCPQCKIYELTCPDATNKYLQEYRLYIIERIYIYKLEFSTNPPYIVSHSVSNRTYHNI